MKVVKMNSEEGEGRGRGEEGCRDKGDEKG